MAVTKSAVDQWVTLTAEVEKLTAKFDQELTTIKDQAQHYTNMCVELAQQGITIAKATDSGGSLSTITTNARRSVLATTSVPRNK